MTSSLSDQFSKINKPSLSGMDGGGLWCLGALDPQIAFDRLRQRVAEVFIFFQRFYFPFCEPQLFFEATLPERSTELTPKSAARHIEGSTDGVAGLRQLRAQASESCGEIHSFERFRFGAFANRLRYSKSRSRSHRQAYRREHP